MTKINEEQRQALQEHGDGPIEVVDPDTSRVYVLIAREQYERLRPLFEHEPLSHQEQRALLRRAGARANWDDSEMDAYDHYDEHKL